MIYGNISDADMEKGQMRCDVNVSVAPEGSRELGTKIELKNLNSISGVRKALHFEIERQINVLSEGGTLFQETRRWDDLRGETIGMRTKESAHDYRYFPDPDLLPVKTEALVREAATRKPELPWEKRARFVTQYEVSDYDAGVLANDLDLATYFEKAAEGAGKPKHVANWVLNDLQSALSTAGQTIRDCGIAPQNLRALVALVDDSKINGRQAKEVFTEMFASGKTPQVIVEEKGLKQESDAGAIEPLCDQVIADNPKSVEDFRSGKVAALNYLKGQVMKLSKGKANPAVVDGILKKKLEA